MMKMMRKTSRRRRLLSGSLTGLGFLLKIALIFIFAGWGRALDAISSNSYNPLKIFIIESW
jgi:hypothetical protein